MLRLSAAILLIAGPILALILRSWGVGSLVFGPEAIVLGIWQARLGGAFTGIEGLVRLLFGAAP
jgi:hypothetical protein